MYTDEIEIEAHSVTHIWYLAKKYLISSLEQCCTDYLDTQLTPANAAIIYDQSLLFDNHLLVKKCRRILSLRTDQCLAAPSFVDIQRSSLRDVIELKVVNSDELALFRACCRWATHNCQESVRDVTSHNIKHVLGDVLQCIRFEAMSLNEFREHVLPTNLLPDAKADEILRHLTIESRDSGDLQKTQLTRRYRQGQRFELFNKNPGPMTEISGPLAVYDVEVSIDSSVVVHELLLYDAETHYDKNVPQGSECLEVKITLNGGEIFLNHCNKQDSDVADNVKKIPMFALPLTSGTHALSVTYTWKGRCVHCDHFAQVGQTIGAQFCYNCGNHSGLKPSPIRLSARQSVTLESDFVSVSMRNNKMAAMPFVGLTYSDPCPVG